MNVTPKQQVLERHPQAESMRGPDHQGWSIIKPDARGIWHTIGCGYTPARAWADALRIMQGK